jgi:hypothetical protein
MTSNAINELYGGFVSTLPANLQQLGRSLPHVLALAPDPRTPWSDVFSNEVTLNAPALVGESFPRLDRELIRRAVLGHALSVIEAFGVDRVADGQVRPTPELLGLLEHLRNARDAVLERVWAGTAKAARLADAEARDAIREEHELLSCIGAATFVEYRRISLGKQAVGFPASLALARAAGATDSQLEEVKRALRGVWLGLQFEDDAVDWEDDWSRGQGAWAVSLARRRLEAVKQLESDERPTEPDLIRRRVFNMRVLYLMLREARYQYRGAWRYSRILGAHHLADWAEKRKLRADELLPLEEKHAGYVVRSRKLAAWAAEVLS